MSLDKIHGAGTKEWVTEKYDSLRFLKELPCLQIVIKIQELMKVKRDSGMAFLVFSQVEPSRITLFIHCLPMKHL